jgi:hypothetical protein
VNDVAKRRKYAALVEGVQAGGGEALVFSSMHVSGAGGGWRVEGGGPAVAWERPGAWSRPSAP